MQVLDTVLLKFTFTSGGLHEKHVVTSLIFGNHLSICFQDTGTCRQNVKLFTNKFKSGGLHEKHVVATRNVGNRLSLCLQTDGNQEKPVSRWPVAGPSEY